MKREIASERFVVSFLIIVMAKTNCFLRGSSSVLFEKCVLCFELFFVPLHSNYKKL